MPDATVTLIKGDRIDNSLDTDYRDAIPVNMYAVEKPLLGSAGYMIQYPGLTDFATGTGVDRGANYNERFDSQYRVSGTSLIEVKVDGSIVNLGVVSGSEQVAMPYSFNTQCIIADGKMFLYDNVNGLVEVNDTDLGNPIDGTWIDGYYFLTDGEFIYHTDINDESSIDPLKFATAEFSPDKTLGVAKTQDNKVIVFGRYTTEYFINAATENFAFQRVQTRAQKIGIVATHAKTETKNGFYITGGRKDEDIGVYVVSVGKSTKVSTREIDKIIREYTEPELSNIRMESRTENNITFILLHLPKETLCFNETIASKFGVESAWCLLKTDVNTNNTYRAINSVFDSRLSEWVCGDKISNKIGLIDNSKSTHYNEVVEWILYTPFIGIESASINKLEIETIPGHTITNDATVAFSITTDGVIYGEEWFNIYGEVQNYHKRFIIRRIGYVRDWIGFKFRGASKSRMTFSTMSINYG